MATIPASATFGSYQPLTGRNQGLTVAPGAVAASQCYPTNYGFYRLASTGPARLNIPTCYPSDAQITNDYKGPNPTGSARVGPIGAATLDGLYLVAGA